MMTETRRMAQAGTGKVSEALLGVYERELSALIGVISKFIVTKQYQALMAGRGDALDRQKALELVDLITKEAAILIGPVRSENLRKEMIEETDNFFKGVH